MRLFYASDLHGSERLWRKFVNAPAFYEVDLLIMGGDLTGKVMVPVVQRGPGEWVARVLGRDETGEVEELERRIRLNGQYPVRVDEHELARLQDDAQHRDAVFRGLMRDELRRWVALAEEKLAGTGVRCLVMPGNDDEWDVDEVLAAATGAVESVDGRVVRVNGVQVLSCAWANPTPWNSPREEPEDALLDRLEGLAAGLEDGVPAVFNLHVPPYDSGLDLAPELTDDLRVVRRGGEPRLVPVGSTAVRTLIERHRPLLSLHGHVHESRGVARLGTTLCINPGSAYAEGVIDGAIVEIDDRGVVSHQLVSG
jgi:Icc-related predicted phosphoesterase